MKIQKKSLIATEGEDAGGPMMTQSELFPVRMMTPIMESVTPGEILDSNLNTFSTTSIVITP